MFEGSADAGMAALAALIDRLRGLGSGGPDVDDAVRIDRIRLLEDVRSAAAAAQAAETTAFAASQRAALTAAGVGTDKIGRGHTFRALSDGRVSEWRAMLVARETAWLSRDHRARADRKLSPRLEHLGDRQVEAETKTLAYRLDPEGAAAKARGADADRRVGLRPAPETMARLTALLPVAQGVACYAALRTAADTARSQGDCRSRRQLMADLLAQRLTGHPTADAVPVEINLIMTTDTLLHPASPNGNEPAHLDGYGPTPAPIARDLALTGTAPRWIRRLFTSPYANQLLTQESRRRTFTPGQRRFLQLHDQWCRTPSCGAPIRHADHITPHEAGRPTHLHNGRGTCETCTFTDQSPGWHSHALHALHATTPGDRRPASNRNHHPHRTPVPKSTTRPPRHIPARVLDQKPRRRRPCPQGAARRPVC
jgi:hypothetical protein